MKRSTIHIIFKTIIMLVWLVNGLYCKVLNQVPRHMEIVARILGQTYARPITFMIGIYEILMAVWIFTGFKAKENAFLQITIILIMNTLEYILAPDLLLWGKFNSLFAILFCIFIGVNEFKIKNK